MWLRNEKYDLTSQRINCMKETLLDFDNFIAKSSAKNVYLHFAKKKIITLFYDKSRDRA